ncbi:MAG: flavocytochrome c [Angelakisella sp.]
MNLRKQKLISMALCASMLLSLATACGTAPASSAAPSADAAQYKAGTYSQTVNGHNGEMTLAVTVDETSIQKIEVTQHKESAGISDPAFEKVIGGIVEGQTLAVDAVSGATVTSNAIIEGVKGALTQAGADIEKLMVKKDSAEKAGETIEMTTDVCVIGGGGAGLTAAITAKQNGAEVIVLEKMSSVGGNTILAGGALNAPDPERQAAQGIEDSVENFYQQTMAAGDNQGNPELVRIMAENSLDAVHWLKEIGVPFREEFITVPGGLHPRGHATPPGQMCIPWFDAFKKNCEESNIEILLETKAEEIIMENGKAVGVKAKRGNDEIIVKATKGVVLATGGFGNNVEMRQKYNSQWPTLDATIGCTNGVFATGDGIAMAEAVGANLIDMEFIQLLPYGDAATGSMKGNIVKDPKYAIFLNKEGKRFVDEYARRDVMTQGVFDQTDTTMYMVVDGKSYPSMDSKMTFGGTVQEGVDAGKIKIGNTIEELAVELGLDPAVVKETVDRYNSAIDNNTPDEVGKSVREKIDTAPFIATTNKPTVHHTMGGVQINTEAQVLDKAGNVISGLYAAGEVTGDIHGTNRIGGNALTDLVVFGKIAGKNVALGK